MKTPGLGIGNGREPSIESVSCAGKGCSAVVPITQTTLDFAKAMNHVRKRQGVPLAKKSEIALCQPCYRKHREKLVLETNLRTERDEEQWRLWLQGDVTDEQLFTRVTDAGSYRELVAKVKAQRGGGESKKSKSRKTADDVWQKSGGDR